MFCRVKILVIILYYVSNINYAQEIINLKVGTKSPPTYFNQANLFQLFKPINTARVDLFDEYSNPKLAIPKNYAGEQEPDDDQNYLGIVTYFGKGTITLKETIDYGLSNAQYTDEYSSYIQLEIPTTLNPDNEYNITFKVSLADNAEYATSGFGVYFSDKLVKADNNTRLKITPQITFPNVIKDKNNWVELKTLYKPTGKEKYIIIGCFNTNFNTEKVENYKGFGINKSYYYVSSIKIIDIPKDMDKDGVIDKEDLCIDVFGLKELKGCPDKDGDGIADKDDTCPTIFGLAKYNGCPDTDNDGIPDYLDKCPTVVGIIVNNGCPEVVDDIVTTESLKSTLTKIEFENGKENLTPNTSAILNKIILQLNANPNIQLLIDGLTASENLDITKDKVLLDKRAKTIRAYLLKNGCNPDVISIVDYGIDKTKKDKNKDRRVEY